MTSTRLRLLLPAATALLVLAVVLLGDVSPAALLPRTATGVLILLGLLAAVAAWSGLVVPRLTRRPVLRSALTTVPVLALAGLLLVPAVVVREVDEGLLEGVPVSAPGDAALPLPAAPTGGPVADTATAAPPEVTPAPTPAPAAPEPTSELVTTPPTPAAPERLASGEIRGVGHRASGQAVAYQAQGTRFVRLEDLQVQGAVDVVVYLVPGRDQTEPGGGLSLGGLKGTRGNANYVLPEGIDLSRYGAVLLWCRAFDTPIAVATLG